MSKRHPTTSCLHLPAAAEPTLLVAAGLEFIGVGLLDTLTVSVGVVELSETALVGVNPLVADAGFASSGIVLALATAGLRDSGGGEDDEHGDGRETHYGGFFRIGRA